MAGPSSANSEHCVPCTMDESIDQQPISGQTSNFETKLVEIYGERILANPGIPTVSDVDLDLVSPRTHRRHEAALHCAEIIADGKCPLFMLIETSDKVFKLFPKPAPSKRHLRIAN